MVPILLSSCGRHIPATTGTASSDESGGAPIVINLPADVFLRSHPEVSSFSNDDPESRDGLCHIFIVGLAKSGDSYLFDHPSSFTAETAINLNSASFDKIQIKGSKLECRGDKNQVVESSFLVTSKRNKHMLYPTDKTLDYQIFMYVSDGGFSKNNQKGELKDGDFLPPQIYLTGDNKLYMGKSDVISCSQRNNVVKLKLVPQFATFKFYFSRTNDFPESDEEREYGITGISRILIKEFQYLVKLDFFDDDNPVECSGDDGHNAVRHCPVVQEQMEDNSPVTVYNPFKIYDNPDNVEDEGIPVYLSNVVLNTPGKKFIEFELETMVKNIEFDNQGKVKHYFTSFNIFGPMKIEPKPGESFSSDKNYTVKVKLSGSINSTVVSVMPWEDFVNEEDLDNLKPIQ